MQCATSWRQILEVIKLCSNKAKGSSFLTVRIICCPSFCTPNHRRLMIFSYSSMEKIKSKSGAIAAILPWYGVVCMIQMSQYLCISKRIIHGKKNYAKIVRILSLMKDFVLWSAYIYRCNQTFYLSSSFVWFPCCKNNIWTLKLNSILQGMEPVLP